MSTDNEKQVPNKQQLTDLCELAIKIAQEAGTFLASGQFKQRREIDTKSSGTDMVSEMDRGAEKLIVDAIVKARPDDAILGEEGCDKMGTSGYRWVIDPLDGTTNYLYGLSYWAVSIGIEFNDNCVVGVVVAPALDLVFHSYLGAESFENSMTLEKSVPMELGKALTGTGFAYSGATREIQGKAIAKIVGKVRDIRRLGAGALDLCFVASGRLDAYFESGLQPWDKCAGSLIAHNSGRVTKEIDVSAFGLAPITFASNASVAQELEELILSSLG